MTIYRFSNFCQSTLESAVSVSDTVLKISAADVAKFPIIVGGEAFYLTIWDRVNNPEIVQVNSQVGQLLTVVRAQEGTAAVAWQAGTVVRVPITAALLDSLRAGSLITNIVAPVSGQILKYNGTQWANSSLATSEIPGLDTSLLAITNRQSVYATTGTANALTLGAITGVPLLDGLEISLRITTVNTSQTVTFAYAGGTARPVLNAKGVIPQIGAVSGDLKVRYSLTLLAWLILDSGAVNLSNGWAQWPAAQIPSADANTLDDYAEVSFTPAWAFGGVVNWSYDTQAGGYTKIGNTIQGWARLTVRSKGAATGNCTLTLPVACASYGSVTVAFAQGMVGLAGTLTGYIIGSTLSMGQLGATSFAALLDTAFSNVLGAPDMIISFRYPTA